MSEQTGNKLIAKNTLLLYIRMAIALVVSLYTSRVVLNVLGVEDFGIYGIAGGFIYSLGFINSSLSSATSRYITYEMGKKGERRLNTIFNNALIVHFGITLLLLVLAETIGLWFLVNKLNIPSERMFAAHWVYQLSVLSMLIGVSQVPYNAEIIAHERLNIYAYVEMLNVVFKLLIVYALLICDTDKLILYSILNAVISIGTALYYRYYCHKNFDECYIDLLPDKETLRGMLSFSGWDLVGNLGVTARTQGIAILINMFFGVVANAASSISGQILSTVMAFASNILMAVKPQIIKSYAGEDYVRANMLLKYTFIGIFYLILLIGIPIIVEMRFIIQLWLGQVPQYTVGITTLSFIFSLVSTFAMMMITIPHAAGKNKKPSLFNGLLYLSAIPVTYVLFNLHPIIWYPYIYNIITIIIGLIYITWLTSQYLPGFSFRDFILTVCFKHVVIACALSFIVIYTKGFLTVDPIIRVLIICVLSFVLVLISLCFISLNIHERNYVFKKVLTRVFRNQK